MAFQRGAAIILISFIICMAFIATAEATYRKPPFNGSIFGKRNNIDYEASGKALSAMCEITLEACQSWFPQDKK